MYVYERSRRTASVGLGRWLNQKDITKAEFVHGYDDPPDQDYIDIEEETPLTALKAQCQATGRL
eukprot:9617375-Prorocentrum_lima.AAC.1